MNKKINDEQVLDLLKEGLGQRETARRLGVYHRSVKLAADRLEKDGKLDTSQLTGWGKHATGRIPDAQSKTSTRWHKDAAWSNVRYQDARIIER